jgi:hypothetical protein
MQIIATQDDILNASTNAACRICDQLSLDDESWYKLYDVLVKTLNEILDNPEYRNVN